MSCIFCQIVKKEAPAKIIFEDEKIVVFPSLNPEAPLHLLLVPKKHLEWQNLKEEDFYFLAELFKTAQRIAKEQKVALAHKLIFNVGLTAHISHIHLHLLGGWQKDRIPLHNI